MGWKLRATDIIVARLRQVNVLVSQARNGAEAIRSIEVTEVPFRRWYFEYGALKDDQVRRLKGLTDGSQRVRRTIPDPTFEGVILEEVASGNSRARLAAGLGSTRSSPGAACPNASLGPELRDPPLASGSAWMPTGSNRAMPLNVLPPAPRPEPSASAAPRRRVPSAGETAATAA